MVILRSIQTTEAHEERPGEDADHADELADEARVAIRNQHREHAPDADGTVNRDRTDRIVDLQLVEHDDRPDDEQAADRANQRRDDRRRRQRISRDRDQPGERAVECHRQVSLAEPEARQQQRGDEAAGGRHVRVDEHERHGVRFADVRDHQFRTAVEAEPAEPQDQRAERGERQVAARDGVDLAVRTVLALARSEHEYARERSRGTAEMHRARSREVEVAEASRQEATAPVPEALDWVDEAGQHDGKCEERPELHALGDGTRHDRHRGCDEHDLEEEVRQAGVVGIAATRDYVSAELSPRPSIPSPNCRNRLDASDGYMIV